MPRSWLLLIILATLGLLLCAWAFWPRARSNRCPQCEKVNPDRARFCSRCGRDLQPD